MNLSDPSDDDSSSDECPVPAKRPRADTYGASSTTSHGSVLQESDDESPGPQYSDKYSNKAKRPSKIRLSYTEQSPGRANRFSRSSLSENCSSPNEPDDYRPGFNDNDGDQSSRRPSFQGFGDNKFYNKSSDSQREYEAYSNSGSQYSGARAKTPSKIRLSYTEQSPERSNRLSRSSLSEPCSSPNDQYDRPGFKDDAEENPGRASFQTSNDNAFYNKSEHERGTEKYISGYSEISKRMMSNMGHKPGKGLGKFETGRVEPVQASTQKGRRGLGLKASVVGEVPKDFKWTPDEVAPEAKEDVFWMPKPPEETLSGDILEKWLKKGPKKLTIDDETEFVDSQILKGILNSKTIFDDLDGEDMRNARFRSNPYETIGSVIFLNRAAVKMANMDAVFDFMFTKPKKQNGENAVEEKDLLYFADVCAGPGGFSEYVLYRRGWRAKGFGFTLKGLNDFKLSDFFAGPPETFNPYYGVKEDGNIFDPANLTSLKDFVLKQTDDTGVHFLMADGGFSVEGQENIQEILSKQLYLCQCLAALMLVRTGGHFVVKLFDVFTTFSVGLVYIMYRCFDKVSIHKPVTSRPANSERYLICKWKKSDTDAAEKHLFSVNSTLWNNRLKNDDVSELVPLSVLREDEAFFEYIYKSNCSIGEKQIKNLLKIAAFSKDKTLKEESQAEMREQCLKLWKLPDKVRTKPERRNPDEILLNILNMSQNSRSHSQNTYSFKNNVLNKPPRYLERSTDLKPLLGNVYDWHFTFLSSTKKNSDLKMFIACGGKQVYQLKDTIWRNLANSQIILPANTLLYGEIVREYSGQGSKQMHSKALHVIDAMMLGGVDVSTCSLTDRVNQCNLFCNALEKAGNNEVIPLRCKRFFTLETFPTAVANLEYRAMKMTKQALTVDIPKRGDRLQMFTTVGSLLFIKEIKEPWVAQISKKSGHRYYFRMGPDRKPISEYRFPEAARLDMINAYSNRVMWNWEAASAVFESQLKDGVTKMDMEQYVRSQL